MKIIFRMKTIIYYIYCLGLFVSHSTYTHASSILLNRDSHINDCSEKIWEQHSFTSNNSNYLFSFDIELNDNDENLSVKKKIASTKKTVFLNTCFDNIQYSTKLFCKNLHNKTYCYAYFFHFFSSALNSMSVLRL